MRTNRNIGIILTALLVAMLTLPAVGQATGQDGNGANGQGQGAGPGGQGGQGGRRNFDPAQMMQRMMDHLKQQMGASDDEFAAIQPKIQKVMDLQRDAGGGRMMGMFGRRGRNNGADTGAGATTQPVSPVQAAMADLRTTLDDPNASADTIKTKLDALRQARTKARDDLKAAQDDLKSVLTQRQEAVLVLGGILD